MIYNVHYLITKGSDCKTLVKGDHVYLEENGDLICIEARGWLEKETAESVMKSVEYELDTEWRQREIDKCQKRLKWLMEIL